MNRREGESENQAKGESENAERKMRNALRCAALPAVALAKAGLYSLNAALSLFISLLRF